MNFDDDFLPMATRHRELPETHSVKLLREDLVADLRYFKGLAAGDDNVQGDAPGLTMNGWRDEIMM